jgi:hypothetical protein
VVVLALVVVVSVALTGFVTGAAIASEAVKPATSAAASATLNFILVSLSSRDSTD